MTGTLAPMQFGTDVAAKGVRERALRGRPWRPAHPGRAVDARRTTTPPSRRHARARRVGIQARGLHRGPGPCGSCGTTGCRPSPSTGPSTGTVAPTRGRSPDSPSPTSCQRWSADDGLIDDMVADWRATLDAVQALPEVTDGPVRLLGPLHGDDLRPPRGGGRAPGGGGGARPHGDRRAHQGPLRRRRPRRARARCCSSCSGTTSSSPGTGPSRCSRPSAAPTSACT